MRQAAAARSDGPTSAGVVGRGRVPDMREKRSGTIVPMIGEAFDGCRIPQAFRADFTRLRSDGMIEADETVAEAWQALGEAAGRHSFHNHRTLYRHLRSDLSSEYPHGYCDAAVQEAILRDAGAAGVVIDAMYDQDR